ncbi:MAG: hydantoinase B/oxoprolinase family protein, partial [Nitrospinota bacterium]
PFVAAIEHTNLIGPEHYGGKHIVYLSNYLDTGHRLYGLGHEELLEEYRLADLSELATSIFHRSENAMREAAKQVPDGEYPFQVHTDGYEEPLSIRVEVRVRGSSIHVDYTGSSPQVDRGVNVPPAFGFAYTVYALKCLLCPQVPNSEGTSKPISITAPEGTVLNPRFPAAVNARALVGHFLPAALFGALAKAIPGRVPAAGGAPIWTVSTAGVDREGRPFAVNFHLNPGQGATAQRDGHACLSFPSNLATTPIEVLESTAPILIERKAILRDSGGAGKFRGGNGQSILIKSLASGPLALTFQCERMRHAAYGLFGGKNGRPGRVLLNGRPINPRRQWLLMPGDRLVLELPSGGGYGNPKERDAKLVEWDVQEGLVSLHKVRSEYGYMGEVSQG